MWQLLRDPRIRLVWLGETVNAIGSGLTFWALAWLLYRTYPDNPTLTGLILAVQSICTLLGLLVFGPLLDHWDRRRVLIFSNALLAFLTLLLPPLVRSSETLPLVFLVSGLIGLASSLPRPARLAALPSFAPPERWQGLQALFGATEMTANLLAPVMAGFLIAGLGAANVLYLDAATYALAALAYLLVRFPPQAILERAQAGLRGWAQNLASGARFVLERPALWGTLLAFGCVNAVSDAFGSLLLPRVADALAGGLALPAWLGQDRAAVLLGLFDFCVVVPELLLSLWFGARAFRTRTLLLWLTYGCLIPPLGMLGVVLAPGLGVALLFCALQGTGYAAMSVLLSVLVARVTPEELRGRVSSVRVFLAQVFRPLGTAGGGALLGSLGMVRLTLLLVGGATLLTGYGMARALGDRRSSAQGDQAITERA